MFTLLQEKYVINLDSMEIQIDKLHCIFTWDNHLYHFHYQRRLAPPISIMPGWERVPALQSGYVIEREQPLAILHRDKIIWREPPFVMTAAYVTGGNIEVHLGASIQETLGNMQLHSAHVRALFFPEREKPLAMALHSILLV